MREIHGNSLIGHVIDERMSERVISAKLNGVATEIRISMNGSR